MQNLKRPCYAAIGAAYLLIAAQFTHANATIYKNALGATGWVIVPHESKSAMGTCWVIDGQRKLALSSLHVIGDAKEVLIYFPEHNDGKLLVDAAAYLHGVRAINGRVIAVDQARDLALVELESLPARMTPLPLAKKSAQPGDKVHSIGNSGLAKKAGVLWRYTRGNVRQVYARAPEDGAKPVTLVETQSPVNSGDSGGPLLNDRGQIVGITMAYDKQQQLVSYSIDVSEIRSFLTDAQAKFDKRTPKDPPERVNQKLIGTWKLTAKMKDVTVSGNAEFTDQGLYLLSEAETSDDEPQRGRFAYANGVLMIITSDNQASFRLTWVSKDHFTCSSGGIDLTFQR